MSCLVVVDQEDGGVAVGGVKMVEVVTGLGIVMEAAGEADVRPDLLPLVSRLPWWL